MKQSEDRSDPLAALEARGFRGFVSIGQLHSDGCLEVPNEPGVYVVLVRAGAPHGFLARSSAPAWRGREPSLPLDELERHWVPGATILYAGRAAGPGVRSRLRQRIKRYLRFGHGKVVAHWGGRLIWQLREANRLLVAWRVCAGDEAPARIETELLERFEREHGALPFANLRHETAAADEDED